MTIIDNICRVADTVQPFVVLCGVAVAIITLCADHKRRKRQATLELYQPISEEAFELRNNIKGVFGDGVIDPNSYKYNTDKELRRSITRFLALYERLSVGINLNILDLTVFMRMAGRSTVDWYDRLEPIIAQRRERRNRPSAFSDFEKLCRLMRMKYAKLDKHLR